MRVSATAPTPLAPAAWAPVSRGRDFLLASTEKVRRFFVSLRSGTELVRDPFSAEQNRD